MAVYLGNIAQTEYQCFAIPVMIRKWTRFSYFWAKCSLVPVLFAHKHCRESFLYGYSSTYPTPLNAKYFFCNFHYY